MSDLKITKGEWGLHKYSKCNVQNTNGRVICSTASYRNNNDNGEHILENEANAALICEAGNVYNETGLTPRELLEKVNSLKETLHLINNALKISTELDRAYWSRVICQTITKNNLTTKTQ